MNRKFCSRYPQHVGNTESAGNAGTTRFRFTKEELNQLISYLFIRLLLFKLNMWITVYVLILIDTSPSKAGGCYSLVSSIIHPSSKAESGKITLTCMPSTESCDSPCKKMIPLLFRTIHLWWCGSSCGAGGSGRPLFHLKWRSGHWNHQWLCMCKAPKRQESRKTCAYDHS